jgi:putative transposase
LCGFGDRAEFQRAQRQWIEQALEGASAVRDDRWSEAIAVGSLAFIETVQNNLGVKAMHREVIEANGTYTLREPAESYARNFTGEMEPLSAENTLLGDRSAGNVGT